MLEQQVPTPVDISVYDKLACQGLNNGFSIESLTGISRPDVTIL